ncbi:MAG: iron-siderophore ABC transporter substrate-binding protein, partial [Anaerolineae bacterium]|nr:iron-siderophore ABC transporter substrate-binding protein [Anaerolineae bacterium]
LAGDVVDVGTRQEPNLELIAELEPDLILTAAFRATNNFDELNAIAPTIAFNPYPDPATNVSQYEEMLATFITIAEVMGREAVGEQVIADLQATFAAAQSALETAGRTDETFILSQGWVANDAATFRLFTDNAMAVQILEQIGLENAWNDAPQLYGFTEISFEGFASVEDTNFFYVAQGDANEAFAESPLWNGLPFVQSGRDYYLGGDVWLFGGPLSAEVLVETILNAMDVELLKSEATAAVDASAFPVTIEHKFGSTTVTEVPQRVVVLGFTEQDPYLALGVIPVAVRYWFGDESNAVFPWAQDEASGEVPLVLNMPYGNLNYEAILELEPDLISAIDAGITEEEYENLSQIAPTLAQSDEYVDYGTPWQVVTQTIGRVVGKSGEAEALIAEVENLFEASREAHPEFSGKSIVVAYNFGGTYGYYTGQDSRGRFFTNLGFVIPEELDEIAGEQFYANISAERFDLFNQDVAVFLSLAYAEGGQEGIESDPLLSQLGVFQEGNVVFVPAELDDALQFSTVLSIPFALEGLVPELAAALDDAGN